MTNAEAIRNCTDEELAKLLGALVIETARRATKGVAQRIFTDFGLVEELSLANATVDAICDADSDVADGYLQWLKLEAKA